MNNEELFQDLTKIRGIDKEITTSSNKLSKEVKLSDDEEVTKEIEDQIIKAVEKWISDNGSNIVEMYADYDDELSDEDIERILNSKNPEDTFYEIIDDYYNWESREYYEDEIFNQLELEDEIKTNYINAVRMIAFENILIEPDYNHFKRQMIDIDTYIKKFDDVYGDIYRFDDEDKLEWVAEPVEWLLEKQGYSADEFISYYNSLQDFEGGYGKTDYDPRTFFGSLAQELDNFTAGGSIEPVFLGSVSLEEIISNPRNITIPKDVTCGFVDTTNGAGGLLEIALEKDINLPVKEVSMLPKHGYRYNVDEIYGLNSNEWDTEFILEGIETSRKEYPSDYIDRKNLKYKKDPSKYFDKNNEEYTGTEDTFKKVKDVMKLSPMNVVKEDEELVYQHPELPVFYMSFKSLPGGWMEIEADISQKEYDKNNKVILKSKTFNPSNKKELYKAIDEVSYVTKDNGEKALKRVKDDTLKESIQYFIENSWL